MLAFEPGDPRLRCPVCGQLGLTVPPYADFDGTVPDDAGPPYEDHLGKASYEECPHCGFEFGSDDNPGTAAPVSFEQYRREWESRIHTREIESRFEQLLMSLLDTAAVTFGTAAMEEWLRSLLRLMEEHEDMRSWFVSRLQVLIDWRSDDYLRLYRPGVLELLEFSMHRLRWDEIRRALAAIDVEGVDLRERAHARRVLAAYADPWSNADIYTLYRSDEG